ncbi:MAG: hypothetical protein UT32_C0003G0013 [Parcubacteria group bacterium GW2011_GWC2_39_14]|nr:MAG: hypothetical protein UT32_C0003G0013 [Parcubacteria group bacterium GW2011_GWC2_39_14]KKR54962.1 MAG: hypothetical protein UT91_C0006G0013 [Parcubacteria group bacterium GW2011_GWA2_40_23]
MSKRRTFVLATYQTRTQRTHRSDDECPEEPLNFFAGCTPAVRDEGSGRFIANDVRPHGITDDECTDDCEKLVSAETLNPAHANGAHWFLRLETTTERLVRFDRPLVEMSPDDVFDITSDPLEALCLREDILKARADDAHARLVQSEQRKRAMKRIMREASAAAHA